MRMTSDYKSWGQIPNHTHKHILKFPWVNSELELVFDNRKYLPYGMGRSYGDSCLNKNEVLIDSSKLNHIHFFDKENGTIRCEAGVSFDDLLSIIVPYGWFLPVTPGTRFVTVGGALANDVHGKNHHQVGSFGNHITAFELKRSNNETLTCSLEKNSNYFKASIGGLGLTGFISWVEFNLKKIVNPYISTKQNTFTSIEHFFELDEQNRDSHEYSVAWVDTTSTGNSLGRGVSFVGQHSKEHPVAYSQKRTSQKKLAIPVNFPNLALNAYTVNAFNNLYYALHKKTVEQKLSHYAPFFYPLDNILNWNKMYGKRGFFQHQCVVPINDGKDIIVEILKLVSDRGMASFLSVLKRFGNIPSIGMMSFPREGYTLALDFPNKGKRTLDFLNELDQLVRSVGGAIYPAKDARMSIDTFAHSFPQLEEFKSYIDPAFSSSFWRRVNGQEEL